MLMCSSPRLFAAYRVFHRLPVPGHPPCALLCLTSLYHPRSPSGSQGRSKNGSYTPPQANLRRVFLCSLVLLAIAFSIYIRVINRLLYQRRGLMFDVWSSIQFSRYGRRITGRRLLTFCTSSALRNTFLDAHHMQSRMLLKKPPRCSALASFRIAKHYSQIAPLAQARVAFLFVLFWLSNVRPFLRASTQNSRPLDSVFSIYKECLAAACSPMPSPA